MTFTPPKQEKFDSNAAFRIRHCERTIIAGFVGLLIGMLLVICFWVVKDAALQSRDKWRTQTKVCESNLIYSQQMLGNTMTKLLSCTQNLVDRK